MPANESADADGCTHVDTTIFTDGFESGNVCGWSALSGASCLSSAL